MEDYKKEEEQLLSWKYKLIPVVFITLILVGLFAFGYYIYNYREEGDFRLIFMVKGNYINNEDGYVLRYNKTNTPYPTIAIDNGLLRYVINTNLKKYEEKQFPISENKWSKITIQKIGDKIEFYINSEKKHSYSIENSIFYIPKKRDLNISNLDKTIKDIKIQKL